VEKGEPLGRLSPAVTKRGKQGMGGAADRRGQEAGGDGGTDNRSQGGGSYSCSCDGKMGDGRCLHVGVQCALRQAYMRAHCSGVGGGRG
jgi:hypothetical protein